MLPGTAADIRGIMESSYSIHPAENLVRARVWNDVTVDGMIELIRRMGHDGAFRAHMHVVIDLRESSADWDFSEVQRYRDYLVHIARGPKRRWAAIVVPGTVEAIVYLLTVISEAMSETVQLRWFRDPQQARAWAIAGSRSPD